MTQEEGLQYIEYTLLPEKIKRLNKASTVNYDDDYLWGYEWYNVIKDGMTRDQVRAVVDDVITDCIMASEDTDADKVKMFGVLDKGEDKVHKLNYDTVAKAYGVKHLKDLTDKQKLNLAATNGWTLGDTELKIREAVNERIKKNAETIRERGKNDAKLAREYLSAKFDGDDDKMKAIETQLKKRADKGEDVSYILDKSKIPIPLKLLKGFANLTGGESQMNRYREQIANPTAEDSDSLNPFAGGRGTAVLADVAYAVPFGAPAKALGVTGKVINKIPVKKLLQGGGKLKRGAVTFAKEGVGSGAKELEREIIAGEDIDPNKLRSDILWGGSIPSVTGVGLPSLSGIPVLGGATRKIITTARKGEKSVQVAGEIANRFDNAKKFIKQMDSAKGRHEASDKFESAVANNPIVKEYADKFDKMHSEFVKERVKAGWNEGEVERAFSNVYPSKQKWVEDAVEKEMKETREALHIDENELARRQIEADKALDKSEKASLESDGGTHTAKSGDTKITIDADQLKMRADSEKRMREQMEEAQRKVEDIDNANPKAPATNPKAKDWKPHNRIDMTFKETPDGHIVHSKTTSGKGTTVNVERVPREQGEKVEFELDDGDNIVDIFEHELSAKPVFHIVGEGGPKTHKVVQPTIEHWYKDLGPDVRPSEKVWDPNYRAKELAKEEPWTPDELFANQKKAYEEGVKAGSDAVHDMITNDITKGNKYAEKLVKASPEYYKEDLSELDQKLEPFAERAYNVIGGSFGKTDENEKTTYEAEKEFKKAHSEDEPEVVTKAKNTVKSHVQKHKPKAKAEEIVIEEESSIRTPWGDEGREPTWEEKQTPLYHQWKLDQLIHGNNGHFEVS